MKRIVQAVETLAQALADFDPASVCGSEAVELVEVLARGEKLCAAARARAAVRVDACEAYRVKGHRSGAQWLTRIARARSGPGS